jgi:hypothetical protein
MTQVTIDNRPISVSLDSSSFTVPSGDVLKVTISTGDQGGGGEVLINSSTVLALNSNTTHASVETVLVGGDTVFASNRAHIGGFDVS